VGAAQVFPASPVLQEQKPSWLEGWGLPSKPGGRLPWLLLLDSHIAYADRCTTSAPGGA